MKKTTHLLLVIALLLSLTAPVALRANAVGIESQYLTLKATTLDGLKAELRGIYSYLLLTNQPTETMDYRIVVRKADNPQGYAALLAESTYADFGVLASEELNKMLFNYPWNDHYLSVSGGPNLYITNAMFTTYPDTVVCRLDYSVDSEAPSTTKSEALKDVDAFFDNKLPNHPYPAQGSNLDKIRAINKYICQKYYYGYGKDPYAVDCWGYTAVGMHMLRRAGFPCMSVSNWERYYNAGDNEHEWINVFVEGYWYACDFNVNDTGFEDKNNLSYDEFMLLSSDDGLFKYTSPHPVCDRDYGTPTTMPPILKGAPPASIAPTLLSDGREQHPVQEPALPLVTQLTATSASDTSLTLTWTAVPGARSYVVKYSTEPGPFRSGYGKDVVGATTTTLNNLTKGKTYYIRVSAQLYIRGGGYDTDKAKVFVACPGATLAPTVSAANVNSSGVCTSLIAPCEPGQKAAAAPVISASVQVSSAKLKVPVHEPDGRPMAVGTVVYYGAKPAGGKLFKVSGKATVDADGTILLPVSKGSRQLLLLHELPFTDVPATEWYAAPLRNLYYSNIVNGTSSTHYAPGDTTNRAMVVTLLHTLSGKPKATAASPFADVKTADWFAPQVLWAYEQGYANGVGNHKFAPLRPVARQHFVLFLHRYAGKPASRQSLTDFVDADQLEKTSVAAMRWAVENKLISGKPGGLLDPQGPTTRAEMTKIIERFLSL